MYFLLDQVAIQREIHVGVSVIAGLFHMRLVYWGLSKYWEKKTYDVLVSDLYVKVRARLRSVNKLRSKVEDPIMKETLEKFCVDAEILLQKFEEKNPTSRITSATLLGANLVLIERDILPQYIELQSRPRYLRDIDLNLTKAENAIKRFHELLLSTISELESDDDMRFKAAIMLLDPSVRFEGFRDHVIHSSD